MTSTPIDPQDYLYGVKVVQIEDLRIARGKSRREPSACGHVNAVYDPTERRVYCEDCETDVDPFDMMVLMIERWDAATKKLKARAEKIAEAEAFTLRSRAAKKMDEYWRQRKHVPGCPHCNKAIFPEDVVKGLPQFSRSWIERLRQKEKERTS